MMLYFRATHVNYLSVLLYGNLFLIILHKQMLSFVGLDNVIYILGSVLLSIAMLLARFNVKVLSGFFYITAITVILSVLSTLLVNGVGVQSFVKLMWFIFNYMLLATIVKEKNDSQYSDICRFFIFISWILVLDFLISVVFLSGHRANEGVSHIFLPAPFDVYFGLIAIPFLLNKGWKNLLLVVLILVKLYMSTRAAIFAVLPCFILMTVALIYNRNKRLSWSVKLILIFSLIIFILMTSYYLVLQFREGDITEPYSMIARLVIWSNYLQLMVDYPFGLGPQGAQKILAFYDHTELIMSSEWLKRIFDADIVKYRQNIYISRSQFPSAHSIHVELITSFGIFGVLIWLHLLMMLIKDFIFALSGKYMLFSTIYSSFVAILIYGLFNNFNSGAFFLVLMYVIYFIYRQRERAIVIP